MLRNLAIKTLGSNLAIVGLAMLNSVILSRLLGPSGRGSVAAIMLWPMLFVYIGSCGLFASTTYFSSHYGKIYESIFSSVATLSLIQSIIIIPIGYFSIPLLMISQSSHTIADARLFLFVVPISLLTQHGASLIQGNMHLDLYNRIRLIIPVSYLTGILILNFLGNISAHNVIAIMLLSNIAAFFITLVAMCSVKISLRWNPDLNLMRKMLLYGVKAVPGEVSQLANGQLDQTLIVAWLPAAQLGFYTVAVTSASLGQLLSQATKIVMVPIIAQQTCVEVGVNQLKAIFHRYRLYSVLMVAILLLIVPFLLPLIFGASFKQSIIVAEILLIGSLARGANEVLSGGAQALGNPWVGSRAELAGLAVTIFLLLLLLPSIGIIGAAIASVAAYTVSLFVTVFILQRTYSLSWRALFLEKRESR